MDSSNIKKFYLIFISFWIINFFFSIYQIIPNTDDAYYSLPAIGFSHTNDISYLQLDDRFTFFERFPLYTLIQGLFYKIINLFLPINFYTYRILNILILVSIFILSFEIVKNFVKENKNKDTYKIIFFPILLAISPISQIYLSARPEILGILISLLGIYFYLKEARRVKNFKYEISFFLFGLSILCHPSFIIFNFFIFMHFLLKKELKRILSCLISNFFPILLLIIYYLVNLPESFSQFNIQASGLPYFQALYGLFNYSFNIFYNESVLIGLINTLYYLPTLLLLIFFIFFIKKYFYLIISLKNKEIITSLFLSSLTLLILERNHPYLIGISSFYLILSTFLIPWDFGFIKKNKYKRILKKRTIFISIIAFIFISSWNLVHFTKFNLYKGKFLENSKFINFKNKILLENNAIIITRPEIILYFIKELNKQYTDKNKKIFWLFPDNGRAKNEIERKKSIIQLKKIFNKYSNNEIVWIVAKKNFKNKCLIIHDALTFMNPIKIKFNNLTEIYNSNKHLAFRANYIEYSESVC